MSAIAPAPRATDEGYFPRGRSLLREVQEQRAVGLLYGQRALAIGAINPVSFIGTMLHTRAQAKPFQRLVRTAKMFETIFLGTRAEADKVLAIVDHLHQPVEGVLPEDAGKVPAGSPYSAFDPELMLWTVAVIADSAQYFYELLVRELSEDERDGLWEDHVRFAELFGMPREVAPRSHAEFREYWSGCLASDRVHLHPQARATGLAIMFEIPVPTVDYLPMRVHNLIVLGSLPPRVRELYGLHFSAAQQTAFRAVASGLRSSRPLFPQSLRSGSNVAFFDRVAETESARVARGEVIPGALA